MKEESTFITLFGKEIEIIQKKISSRESENFVWSRIYGIRCASINLKHLLKLNNIPLNQIFNNLLGYNLIEKNNGIYCKTKEDLTIILNELTNYSNIKMDKMKIQLLGEYGNIIEVGNHYTFNPKTGTLNGLFKDNNITPVMLKDIQHSCLGYNINSASSSSYPLCKSESDVLVLINAINNHNITDKNKTKQMDVYKEITWKEGLQIIMSFNPEYQVELLKIWGNYINDQRSIVVSTPFYKTMRKACRPSQDVLFNSIFGVDCPFNRDDLLYVRNSINQPWELRYFSHFEKGKYICYPNQTKSTSHNNHSFNYGAWDFAELAEGVKLPE